MKYSPLQTKQSKALKKKPATMSNESQPNFVSSDSTKEAADIAANENAGAAVVDSVSVPVEPKPSRSLHWKLEFLLLAIMLAVALTGMAVTQASVNGAWGVLVVCGDIFRWRRDVPRFQMGSEGTRPRLGVAGETDPSLGDSAFGDEGAVLDGTLQRDFTRVFFALCDIVTRHHQHPRGSSFSLDVCNRRCCFGNHVSCRGSFRAIDVVVLADRFTVGARWRVLDHAKTKEVSSLTMSPPTRYIFEY